MKFILLVPVTLMSVILVASHDDKASSLCHLGKRAYRSCTPGSVFSVTVKQICTPGYSASVRNVSFSTKQDVYSSYGVTQRKPYGEPGSYEMDHLIPLELGGDNQVTNLWPEAYPGYEGKDNDENRLHRLVCLGVMNLRSAQAFMRRQYRTR